MDDDNFPPRKRAEKLFDDLKAKENDSLKIGPTSYAIHDSINHEQSMKRKSDELNEVQIDNALKETSIKNNPQEIVNTEKVINISKNEPADISHYRGLLQEIDNQLSIVELCEGLTVKNNLSLRCQSALALAVLSRSSIKEDNCKLIFDTLFKLPHRQDFYAFGFCQALLLYMMTLQNISSEMITVLEKCILKVAHSVINQEEFTGNGFMEARIVLLGGERYLTAYKLCEEIFRGENLDMDSLDVLTLCCSSLRSMIKLKTISSGQYKFSDATLKYVLSMIGKSTQEIVLENLIEMEDEEETISISSYTANQCLQVLEQILSADPSSPCKTLDHEDFSLLRCLTKLLEWNMTVLFPQHLSESFLFKVQNTIDAFYLSTLISILKVFSILSFHPDQYDSFTNVKGSMEKLMICILKIYFQSQDNHFDALVLALEMMINFSLKCRKTFVLLCLKKFKINGSSELLAIEALIQILDASLTKINNVKLKPGRIQQTENENPSDQQEEGSAAEEPYLNIVLKAADEDMELSMIVSFISILLMYFIDTKKSFTDFVRERLSIEKTSDAVVVLKKFLQFSVMTGGMPATGILLLRAAIRTLGQLYSSS